MHFALAFLRWVLIALLVLASPTLANAKGKPQCVKTACYRVVAKGQRHGRWGSADDAQSVLQAVWLGHNNPKDYRLQKKFLCKCSKQ